MGLGSAADSAVWPDGCQESLGGIWSTTGADLSQIPTHHVTQSSAVWVAMTTEPQTGSARKFRQVATEGVGQVCERELALLARCQRGTANHAGLGVPCHASDVQM